MIPTIQADLGDVSHCMLDGPDNGIHEQLELRWRQLKQCGKARRIDGTHHLEETDSMFGIFREVLIDHVQSGLEDGVEDGTNLWRQQGLYGKISKGLGLEWRFTYAENANDGSHQVQYFCVPCCRYIALVVNQYSL